MTMGEYGEKTRRNYRKIWKDKTKLLIKINYFVSREKRRKQEKDDAEKRREKERTIAIKKVQRPINLFKS
jgi:hypothetical protein